MNEKICIYPGSFDPITLGHLDIIKRASKIFDKVIVAVAKNPIKKDGWMTIDQRKALIKLSCIEMDNVLIDKFNGLLIDYAKNKGAHVIIKGLRAVTDFENEFQMAQLNYQMEPTIETLFMMTAPEYSYISSSAVREIVSFGGDVSSLLPKEILHDVINFTNQKNIDLD